MSIFDEIAVKHQETSQKQMADALHRENLNAVRSSGKDVVGATDKLAKSTDIDSLIAQVKEVQLASLLGASKPSVILTDQTDLGDKMAELGDKVAAAIAKLDSSDHDGQEISALQQLQKVMADFTKAWAASNTQTTKVNQQLLTAIKAIELSPVVNVPQANVTVPKVDFSPLQDTIKQYFTTPDDSEAKVDLDCYRAQDIIDDKDVQYIGFVNPDGAWYIIENDVKGNKLRYIFGTDNYSKAFSQASTYQYMLLNEAIDAL